VISSLPSAGVLRDTVRRSIARASRLLASVT
jgi:hypothetical protein